MAKKDNKMPNNSADIAETETLVDKVNRWIALPMLLLALASGIMDIMTGRIGWAATMFLCAAWWICICIKELILRKRRARMTSR